MPVPLVNVMSAYLWGKSEMYLPAFAHAKTVYDVFERQVFNDVLCQLDWKDGKRINGVGW
jgi:hypothetical protein